MEKERRYIEQNKKRQPLLQNNFGKILLLRSIPYIYIPQKSSFIRMKNGISFKQTEYSHTPLLASDDNKNNFIIKSYVKIKINDQDFKNVTTTVSFPHIFKYLYNIF